MLVGGLCELLQADFGKLPKQHGAPMQVLLPSHLGAARVAVAGTGATWSVAPRCGRGLWHLWQVLVWHHLHRRRRGWRRVVIPRPFPLATHDGKSDTRRDEQDKETQPELATTMATQAKARIGTLSIWEMLFRTIARLRFYPAETFIRVVVFQCVCLAVVGLGTQVLVLSKSWVGPDPDFGYARPGALSKFWVPLGSDSHFGSGAHA